MRLQGRGGVQDSWYREVLNFHKVACIVVDELTQV